MPTNPVPTMYGRWLQILPPYSRSGVTVVDVICTCGSGIRLTKPLAILKHRGGGCGCLRREMLVNRNKSIAQEVSIGSTYGRLTTESSPVIVGKYRRVTCRCTCGSVKQVSLSSLLNGSCTSCGCYRSELVSAANLKHGMSKTKIYRVWASIVERCTVKTCKSYANYGGRGITVSSNWLSFDNFYADMGEAPFAGATIDRRDNDAGYSKENCWWATRAEQAANTSRNKRYKYRGELVMLKDIAAEAGVSIGALYYRVNTLNSEVADAVTHLQKPRKQRLAVKL